mmetsp:Transcript_11600/g.29531  ORF Transcript_11600/g.29531 Transcript_11600/m.29531 type:complete len:219 (-) Transcript_11600:1554-2210(-)
MYSLMSSLIMVSLLPKTSWASALASSVLPTPVGPEKSIEATGRVGDLSPTEDLCIALEMARTASCCPITRSSRFSCSCNIRSLSLSSSLFRGTPVHWVMISSIASRSTTDKNDVSAEPPLSESRALSSSSLCCRREASSKVWPFTHSSFAWETCCSWDHKAWYSMSLSESPHSFLLLWAPMRARLPASSIKSIALSGRYLSAIYLDERDTAASRASLV